MKLPILNEAKYLSPTGYLEWCQCPHKFYLKRLANPDYVREPQSLPAAVGSAYDSIVTNACAEAIGMGEMPELDLDFLIGNNVSQEHMKKAVPFAKELFIGYKQCGGFKRLMELGVTDIHPYNKETLMVPGPDGTEQEITWFGLPDIGLHDGTLLELKVTGAFGKGRSPTAGYTSCYYDDGTNPKFNHKRCTEPLDSIDGRWATQLTIYSWNNRGIIPFRNLSARIEQVAVGPNRTAYASFQNVITQEFQEALWKKAYAAWVRIHNGNIPDPIPSSKTCMAWGKLCEVAESCDMYKTYQEQGMFK